MAESRDNVGPDRNRDMGRDIDQPSGMSDESITGRADEGDAEEFEDTEDLDEVEEEEEESGR